jgi:hypothetical protein
MKFFYPSYRELPRIDPTVSRDAAWLCGAWLSLARLPACRRKDRITRRADRDFFLHIDIVRGDMRAALWTRQMRHHG